MSRRPTSAVKLRPHPQGLPIRVPPGGRSAFLLIRYRDTGPTSIPELLDVDIYSEQTPTNRVGQFYACLTEIWAATYQEASNRLVERCRAWPHLRWTLPFLRSVRPPR